MTTFTALTTLPGRINASDLGDALERLTPEPIGVGVFELEDGSGLWEVGAYFSEKPDDISLALLAAVFQAEEFKLVGMLITKVIKGLSENPKNNTKI